ncbi:hypothetical protein [Nostoc sp.]|uniref:hypothetical protein n=1 Tax=Nostoc sp. TaxID=1180 RepID=UPI002FF0C5CB
MYVAKIPQRQRQDLIPTRKRHLLHVPTVPSYRSKGTASTSATSPSAIAIHLIANSMDKNGQ